jgi:hypothetical protein
MAKRTKNWTPDVYDLAASTTVVEADEFDDDLDTLPEPVEVEPLVREVAGKPDYRVVVQAREQSGSGDFALVGGMIAGAVVGAVLGLFMAPGRGDETRKQVAQKARVQLEQKLEQAGKLAARNDNADSGATATREGAEGS